MRTVFLFALALAGVASAAAQEPALENRLDLPEAWVGQEIGYEVQVLGLHEPGRPELPPVEGLRFEFVGDVSQDSSSVLIVNGQVQRRSTLAHLYRWRIVPLEPGRYLLPPPRLEVEGRVLEGRELALTVRPPDPPDVARLDLWVDRKRVWPLGHFEVVLDVYLRELPLPEWREQDPLVGGSRLQPALRIPWTAAPEGLEAKALGEWLQPYLSRHPRGLGFTINQIESGGLLFDRRLAVFLPEETEWVEETAADGSSLRWRRYRFRRRFRALEPGTWSFGPASLLGEFVTGARGTRALREKRYVLSPVVEVTAEPVPEEGRPPGWTGGIGRFEVSARLEPLRTRVGAPMTLELRIRGEGLLDAIQPPDLTAVPEVAEDFRVYEASAATEDGERRFLYSLRPLRAGRLRFPPVPLAFFDPETGSFRSTATPAFTIEVEEAERLGAAGIHTAPGAGPDIGAEEGLRANATAPEAFEDPVLPLPLLAAVCAGLGLAWVVLALALGRHRRRQADPRRRARKQAPARARRLLEEARRQQASGGAEAALEACREAVALLLAVLAEEPGEARARTADELRTLAERAGLPEGTCQRLAAWLSFLEAARYGRAAAEGGLEEGEILVEVLIRSLEGRRSGLHPASGLLLLALLLSACSGGASAQLLREAEAIQAEFQQATSREDFLEVAARWQALLERGSESWGLHFNLGNTWARAGEKGRAVASWRRALRLRPADEATRRNLRLVQGAAPSLDAEPPRLGDQIFFWTAWWGPGPQGRLVLVAAFLAFLLGVAALFRSSPLLRAPALAAVFVALLALGGRAWTEQQGAPGRHGVVLEEGLVGRTGDGEGYPEAFSEPLPAAAEFHVLEERGGWIRIRLPERPGRVEVVEGWVPRGGAELW